MKKFIGVLFVISHIAVAYLGIRILGSFWVLDIETPYSTVLIAMLILLPANCIYLLLMRKNILGKVASGICFISNLILYGYPALIVLIFRSYFSLSLFALSHDLVLIALLIQCYCVIPKKR